MEVLGVLSVDFLCLTKQTNATRSWSSTRLPTKKTTALGVLSDWIAEQTKTVVGDFEFQDAVGKRMNDNEIAMQFLESV